MIRAKARARARLARRRGLATTAGIAAAGLTAAAGPASAATIPVTNTGDTGPGSLRNAVALANAGPGADTVTFAANVTGTITTTGGPITAKYDTLIDGPGAGVLTVKGTGGGTTLAASNVMATPDVDVEFEGLTIEHVDKAAVQGFAGADSVTIRNCVLTGHADNPGFDGGGIDDNGVREFNVIDSTITGSSADASGGGISAKDSALTIVGSQIIGNAAGEAGGGVALFDQAGFNPSALTIRDSKIIGNGSQDEGGGIAAVASAGPVQISRSTISGNSSPSFGAGLYTGYTGPVSIDASTFAQNGDNTSYGGAMTIFAPEGSFELSNSTVADNHGKRGAGLYWINYFDEPGRVENSTIVGNGASVSGGGVFRFAYDGTGPGYEGPDDLELSSTVVAANTASGAGPDLAQTLGGAGSFIVDHSLIGVLDGAATLTDGGANKLNAGGAGIGALADNGGPTQTVLPDAAGPLIDAGTANGLTADQRGLARTAQKPSADAAGSDGTDIGAVELADEELIDPFARAKRKQKVKRRVEVIVEVGAGEAATAAATGTLKLGKKKQRLSAANADLAAADSVRLTLVPAGRKAAKRIGRALKRGKKAKASVEVTIDDGLGHSSTTDLKVKLKGKRKKPK